MKTVWVFYCVHRMRKAREVVITLCPICPLAQVAVKDFSLPRPTCRSS